MSKSELRTKVAVLRNTMGISMPEFARLIGRSPHTQKPLESGRLRLSQELAAIISEKTGVALSWLLNQTETGPPVSSSGEVLTRKEFEYHQAKILAEAIPGNYDAEKTIANMTDMFRQTLENAYSVGDEVNFLLLIYRVSKFLDELDQEFIWDAAQRKHKKGMVMSKSQSSGSSRKRRER